MEVGEENTQDMEFIIALLEKKGTMLTDDIVDAIKEMKKEKASPDCNDRTMRNLISLKKKGKIKGRMNKEKRTWEWSLP